MAHFAFGSYLEVGICRHWLLAGRVGGTVAEQRAVPGPGARWARLHRMWRMME